MASGGDELSSRAHDTADAHRRVADALRARAEASHRVALAYADLAEVELREAEADPDPHGAATRRFHAGLSHRHSRTVETEAETTTREAVTEQSHAEAAEARSLAAHGSDGFEE
jgi:hypothetical protein